MKEKKKMIVIPVILIQEHYNCNNNVNTNDINNDN